MLDIDWQAQEDAENDTFLSTGFYTTLNMNNGRKLKFQNKSQLLTILPFNWEQDYPTFKAMQEVYGGLEYGEIQSWPYFYSFRVAGILSGFCWAMALHDNHLVEIEAILNRKFPWSLKQEVIKFLFEQFPKAVALIAYMRKSNKPALKACNKLGFTTYLTLPLYYPHEDGIMAYKWRNPQLWDSVQNPHNQHPQNTETMKLMSPVVLHGLPTATPKQDKLPLMIGPIQDSILKTNKVSSDLQEYGMLLDHFCQEMQRMVTEQVVAKAIKVGLILLTLKLIIIEIWRIPNLCNSLIPILKIYKVTTLLRWEEVWLILPMLIGSLILFKTPLTRLYNKLRNKAL